MNYLGMINRWYDILKLLVSHHQVSIKTLKKQLSLSNQTIQKTIIQLNRELQGIALIEEVEDKYQISIIDFDSFNKIMQGSLKKQTDFNSSSKRRAFILKELIEVFDYHIIYDLADALSVSRGTVANDLKSIRKELKKYNAEIESVTNKGIRLIADEFSRRLIYLHLVQDYFPLDYISHNSIDYMTQIKETFNLTNETISWLIKSIDIVVGRISCNQVLDKPIPNYINTVSDSDLFQEIIYHIETRYQLSLSVYDKDFVSFALNLQAINELPSKSNQADDITKYVFNQMIDSINASFAVDIDKDIFYKDVNQHLHYLINRTIFRVVPNQIFFGELKRKYPFSYAVSQIAVKSIGNSLKIIVSPLEVDYLSLYFEMNLKGHKDYAPPKVAIVSNTGYGTAMLIRKQIERVIVGNIQIDIFTNQTYHQMDDRDYLAIFTTIPLESVRESIPVIHIATVYSDQWLSNEWQNIYTTNIQLFETRLNNVLVLPDTLDSYQAALSWMIQRFEESVTLDTSYKKTVMNQERLHATIFQNGLAFPHGINKGTESIQMMLGILSKPILVNEIEVKGIFMLVIGKELDPKTEKDLVDIYDIVFRLANEQDFQTSIESFKGKEDFLHYLIERRINI